VPKQDYNCDIMLAAFKSIALGIWRVAFAAGAGAGVLLICVAACVSTLVCAPPRIQTR
jgi:hypothetical protein